MQLIKVKMLSVSKILKTPIFILFLFIFGNGNVYSQSCDDLYGLSGDGVNIFLSELDAQTGVVSNVSSVPVAQVIASNSPIDPVNKVIYFFGSGNLHSVDLATGNVISSNPIINPNQSLSSIVYNCGDGNLYGISVDGVDVFLSIIDKLTATVSNISSVPVAQVISSIPTIDPINEIMYFLGSGNLYSVDLATGNLISSNPIINPNQNLSNIEYNCGDGSLYGISVDGVDVFLSIIDKQTAVVSNVSSVPVAQEIASNSPINPINGVIYFWGSENLYCVDLATGNVLNSNPIDNPNQYLSTFNSSCNGCCLECNVKPGIIQINPKIVQPPVSKPKG